MTETATKIKEIIAELTRLEKIKAHISVVEKRINQYLKDRENVLKLLAKKENDVKKLEEMSIRGLFLNILGSKEKEIEEERQEYLSVALKHRDIEKQIELESFEVEVLRKNIDAIPQLLSSLESLKDRREKEILSNPSEEYHDIMKSLYHESDHLQKVKTEIEEAHEAGNNVIKSLKAVSIALHKAQDWGNYTSGTNYTIKSMVDTAISEAYNTKVLINKFQKELGDIGISKSNLILQVNEANSFIDNIFDALITDWIVQRRISTTLEKIANLYNEIIPILTYLAENHEAAKSAIIEVDKKIDNLLVQ